MIPARASDWWRARQPREQRILALGALACAVLLGWALVWHPLHQARLDQQARLSARQADLAFMQQAGAQLQQLRQRDARGGVSRQGKSLLALANASAGKAGLGGYIKRLEPLDGKRVRIEYHGADFDALVAWLATMEQQYGIRANDVSVDRATGAGRVDARLTLVEP